MAAATVAPPTTVPLPLLLDPYKYDLYTFDLYCNKPGLPGFREWVEVFRKSIPGFCRQALTDATVPESLRESKAAEFSKAYNGVLDNLISTCEAGTGERIDCRRLCQLREQCLQEAGFGDIFALVKATENAAALQLLPAVLAGLDAVEDTAQRMEMAVRGILAGNIFDLGAAATVKQFEDGTMDFQRTRESLVARPWVVDCLDAAVAALASGRHKKALLFVDNSGSDVVLGMLPFARELLKGGTQVVIAANEVPSINDITAAELVPLLQQAGKLDLLISRAVLEGSLRCVSSGSADPVIHLGLLSQQVADEAAGVDLLVLEGMGRAIETNLNASFTVDTMKVGMVKHPEVAQCLRGRLYDCVCRWDDAPVLAGGSAP